jgi:uncharacterized membrane protein
MYAYLAFAIVTIIAVLSLLALEEVSKGSDHSSKASDYTLGAGLISLVAVVIAVTTFFTKRRKAPLTKRTIGVVSLVGAVAGSTLALMAWMKIRDGDDSATNKNTENYLLSAWVVGFGLMLIMIMVPLIRMAFKGYKKISSDESDDSDWMINI